MAAPAVEQTAVATISVAASAGRTAATLEMLAAAAPRGNDLGGTRGWDGQGSLPKACERSATSGSEHRAIGLSLHG